MFNKIHPIQYVRIGIMQLGIKVENNSRGDYNVSIL